MSRFRACVLVPGNPDMTVITAVVQSLDNHITHCSLVQKELSALLTMSRAPMFTAAVVVAGGVHSALRARAAHPFDVGIAVTVCQLLNSLACELVPENIDLMLEAGVVDAVAKVMTMYRDRYVRTCATVLQRLSVCAWQCCNERGDEYCMCVELK